jgi:hypothetical protein
MPMFRKKPVAVEAVQFGGYLTSEIAEFIEGEDYDFDPSEHVIRLHTLEGVMTVSLLDWIIKGVQGEFYPCKPGIFARTYEPV